jgi:translation initiation factor IF-3
LLALSPTFLNWKTSKPNIRPKHCSFENNQSCKSEIIPVDPCCLFWYHPVSSNFKSKDDIISKDTRVNHQIKAKQVRLIGGDGEQIGIIATSEAIAKAEAAGLDLVEVSPSAKPPVCKIVDWGKYNYRKEKEAQRARRNQKGGDVKQMRLSLKIGQHDLETKLRKVSGFLEDGHKVKLSVFFRGREMAHQDLGKKLLERSIEKIDHDVAVEQQPTMQGRYMTMMIRRK